MAFPNPHRTDEKGMTLRDYFAAKASEEDIKEHSVGSKSREAVARGTGFPYTKREEVHYTREQAKFRYADAMLKARGIDATTEV